MNTTPVPVVIALGSNLGRRLVQLRAAVDRLGPFVRVVRLSGVWESDPIDCPPGSRPFLNMVLSGVTMLSPRELIDGLHSIEAGLGRRRRGPNDPRLIDLDLIFYGAVLSARSDPSLPHPRYAERSFVLEPLSELGLDWTIGGRRVGMLRGRGAVRRVGLLY